MHRSLDVYFDRTFVGNLIQDENGRMQFSYHEAWLHNSNAMPLSWSLPLRKVPFTQKECRGFFAGILPEQTNRSTIAQILGISARNDYAMLEKLGGECPGAITFLPAGTTYPPESVHDYHFMSENELANVLSQLSKRPLLVGESGLRLSLAGAQDKIAVYIDKLGRTALPLSGAPSTHILKPANDRFPKLVSNEASCLALAKAIGITAVNIEIGSANDIDYLIVERYDRIKDGETRYPIRMHQEDFCQARGIPPECKYQSEGGPSIKNCFALLREASSFPAVDLRQLLDIVIFNIIVGNHDAHAKNFSLLFNMKANRLKIRLAPAYDILSTVYYPELTSKMAMRFGKEYQSNRLASYNIDKFSADADISATAVRKRIVELATRVKNTLDQIKKTYGNIPELIGLIEQRATWLAQVAES